MQTSPSLAAWQQHYHTTLRCGHVWPATQPTHAERNHSVQWARQDPGHSTSPSPKPWALNIVTVTAVAERTHRLS